MEFELSELEDAVRYATNDAGALARRANSTEYMVDEARPDDIILKDLKSLVKKVIAPASVYPPIVKRLTELMTKDHSAVNAAIQKTWYISWSPKVEHGLLRMLAFFPVVHDKWAYALTTFEGDGSTLFHRTENGGWHGLLDSLYFYKKRTNDTAPRALRNLALRQPNSSEVENAASRKSNGVPLTLLSMTQGQAHYYEEMDADPVTKEIAYFFKKHNPNFPRMPVILTNDEETRMIHDLQTRLIAVRNDASISEEARERVRSMRRVHTLHNMVTRYDPESYKYRAKRSRNATSGPPIMQRGKSLKSSVSKKRQEQNEQSS